MSLRSMLYRIARLMGDVRAIRRGPRAIARRAARKGLMRIAGRAINRMIKP